MKTNTEIALTFMKNYEWFEVLDESVDLYSILIQTAFVKPQIVCICRKVDENMIDEPVTMFINNMSYLEAPDWIISTYLTSTLTDTLFLYKSEGYKCADKSDIDEISETVKTRILNNPPIDDDSEDIWGNIICEYLATSGECMCNCQDCPANINGQMLFNDDDDDEDDY